MELHYDEDCGCIFFMSILARKLRRQLWTDMERLGGEYYNWEPCCSIITTIYGENPTVLEVTKNTTLNNTSTEKVTEELKRIILKD